MFLSFTDVTQMQQVALAASTLALKIASPSHLERDLQAWEESFGYTRYVQTAPKTQT